MTHPLPSEHQEGHLSGMHARRTQHLSGIHPPGGRVPPVPPVRFPIAKPGRIGHYVTPTRTTEPTADVARASVVELGLTPPTETQQRWAAAVAARDDRMPDETDMVTHTYQPDAA